MKKLINLSLLIVLISVFLFSLPACNDEEKMEIKVETVKPKIPETPKRVGSQQPYKEQTAVIFTGHQFPQPFLVVGDKTGWEIWYSYWKKDLDNYTLQLNNQFPGESFLFSKFVDDDLDKYLTFVSSRHEATIHLEWSNKTLNLVDQNVKLLDNTAKWKALVR